MFVGAQTARGHRYLYLVESVRAGGRVRQQIVRALGRKDVLLASGELDRLVASLARHSERAMILSEMADFRLISGLACGTIFCSYLLPQRPYISTGMPIRRELRDLYPAHWSEL